MTKHNLRMLDLYTDYLLVSFGATTATGLARVLPEISHDQVTRFLSQQELTSQDLWKIIKPHVRQMQSEEGVLIFDDSVEEKPYTDESELITWHFDHTQNRAVKGINLLTALYLSQEVSMPVDFRLIRKTILETDPKTGKDKWRSPQTKNEYVREMITTAKIRQIPFVYVLADSWFSSADNMIFIKEKAKKEFIMPLKTNRKVAVVLKDKKLGKWTPLSSLEFVPDVAQTLCLEGVPFPLLVSRQVVKNDDGSQSIWYLACSDLSLPTPKLYEIYQKRWKIEEYHKSLKSHAALAKSPTKLPHTQINHFFSSIIAFVKLESYRLSTNLNHFALKGKLYLAATRSAYEQLKQLKERCPDATITT